MSNFSHAEGTVGKGETQVSLEDILLFCTGTILKYLRGDSIQNCKSASCIVVIVFWYMCATSVRPLKLIIIIIHYCLLFIADINYDISVSSMSKIIIATLAADCSDHFLLFSLQ